MARLVGKKSRMEKLKRNKEMEVSMRDFLAGEESRSVRSMKVETEAMQGLRD